MGVPLLDLKAQHETIRADVEAAVLGVLESQRFILGPVVQRFEAACAQYCATEHAIGVSSGTDALLVALMALDIGPGDEVITTPFTFFATAGCPSRVGATPVFADIDPVTFNLEPDRVAERITDRTKAVIVVHLFGQCAPMDPLRALCEDRGIAIIEDAAQSIGAEIDGRRAGSIGDIGCFSFFPSKNLGGIGDGGLVTARDPELARKLRVLRGHGASPKYFHALVGGNFRLDAIQAAVLEVKLAHLDRWHEARQRNAARYHELLADLDGEAIVLPATVEGRRHIWNQYTLRVLGGRRDALREHLQAAGIGCEIYYPRPLHLQECFAYLGHERGQLPVSERASEEVLSIPVYPELTEGQIAEVAAAVRAGVAS